MANKILFCSLISSIGIWTLHLSLISQISKGVFGLVITVGIYAFIRQLSSIAGSVFFGNLADNFNPYKLFFSSELLQFLLSTLLLVVFYFGENINQWFLSVWCAIRFLISGAAFVISFKVVSLQRNEHEKSSVLHLLSTQGAGVFASLFILLTEYLGFPNLMTAIIFDSVSSLLLLHVIKPTLKNDYKTKNSSVNINLLLSNSFFAIFKGKRKSNSYIQILYLLNATGVIFITSRLSSILDYYTVNFYVGVVHFTYGVLLWLFGVIVSRLNSTKLSIYISTFFFMSYALIAYFSFVYNIPALEVSSFVLFIIALTLGLHSTNRYVLSQFEVSQSASVRSSMVFYLGIIFAVGEIINEQMYYIYNNLSLVYVSKIIISLILLFVLKFSTND